MSAAAFRNHRSCRRRDVLAIGQLTALAFGLTDLFQSQARGGQAREKRARSCILLWLDGGPSHLETFDLKPDAPREVRGPFDVIESSVSGIHLSELLPRTAQMAHTLAILRSLTSPLGEHGLANQYLLTGYKPSPVLRYPAYGSVLNAVRPQSSALPPNIAIPEARSGGAGFLGQELEPFVTGGDPSKADFRIADLDFYPAMDEIRLRRRLEFLSEFDHVPRDTESALATIPTSGSFEKAVRLMTSPEAKSAFDLASESEETRARYGPRMFGQSCLLARRLVERGVPFVSVIQTGWDTHENLVLQLRDGYSGAKTGVGLIPTFDQGFSALLTDLSERGLLHETLVVAMGEFGRTPKLNSRGGRDHWPRVFSAVLAGGGVPGGQVIGNSDRTGESPQDDPVTPADLARTIYTLLGVNPDHELRTPDGRPVPVNQGGRVISQLATV